MQHFSYLFIFLNSRRFSWVKSNSNATTWSSVYHWKGVFPYIAKIWFISYGFFLVGCSQWSWSCLLFNTTIDNAQLAIDMDSWKPFTWSLLNWVRYVAVFIWNTANMSEKRCCCSDHNHVSIDANKKWFCTLNW